MEYFKKNRALDLILEYSLIAEVAKIHVMQLELKKCASTLYNR